MNFFENFLNKLSTQEKGDIDYVLSVLRESKVELNNQIAHSMALKKQNEQKSGNKNGESNSSGKEWDALISQLNEKKKEIEEKIEYLEKNRLRLEAEKNIEELRAFVDPNDASNLQYSELLNTHNEMLRKVEIQSAENSAKMDIVLDENIEAPENSSEGAAQKRAEEMVKKMKEEL